MGKHHRRRAFAIVAAIAATGAVASGCAGTDHSRVDAHDVTNDHVDRTPPQVITFSNHYPNVETKCDGHGHRLFVTTHDSAVGRNVLVMPDPTCPGFVAGGEPAVTAGG